MSAAVDLLVVDGVARITLDRPECGNAIDVTLARALADAVTACEAPDVRAILLIGRGSTFCVGGDLGAFANAPDLAACIHDVVVPLHDALARLARLDVPVVAAVRGSAAGAGLGLALSADVVIAAATSKFVMAYGRVGLTPDAGTSWFLPRAVGEKRALDAALTNRVLSASEAMAWGAVARVVDDAVLDEEAERLVVALANGPTVALGRTKRLLVGDSDAFERHLAREAELLVASASELDGREGVRAFLDKRPPVFGGQPARTTV
jgi:2-(1,2-epoxy-1,2-dihydrophenyl)acetyl-CoA isomerase